MVDGRFEQFESGLLNTDVSTKKMNRIIFEIGCTLRIMRLKRSLLKLNKSTLKLKKAKAERIWIENNPKIHILNYPYYKLRSIIIGD